MDIGSIKDRPASAPEPVKAQAPKPEPKAKVQDDAARVDISAPKPQAQEANKAEEANEGSGVNAIA